MKIQSLLITAGLLLNAVSLCASSILQPNDVVAICGDSITQQRIYSVFIEDYLLMCQPVPGVRTLQFGSNVAPVYNLRERAPVILARFKPNIVTMMYGMNDGQYRPLNDELAKWFRENSTDTVEAVKKTGVRNILVGSPSCVNWVNRNEKKTTYNKTLAAFGDISHEVAQAQGVSFADIHTPMAEAIARGEAAEPGYNVGGDGTHVGEAGHLMIAYGFLKTMGFDGAVGTLTVDLSSNTAKTTPGHKIISFENGEVKIESTRYPFCFTGDPSKPSPATTLNAVKYLPFNEELNRYMLVVHGLKALKARVTWGAQCRDVNAADLEKGINLAALFIPENPFSEQFAKVHAAALAQQTQEVYFVKEFLGMVESLTKAVPAEEESINQVTKAGSKQVAAMAAAAASLVIPIQHTLKIEPLP